MAHVSLVEVTYSVEVHVRFRIKDKCSKQKTKVKFDKLKLDQTEYLVIDFNNNNPRHMQGNAISEKY